MSLQEGSDARLEIEVVRERYGTLARYSVTDAWHRFTAERIRDELRRRWETLQTRPGHVILNAGAGNSDLGVCPPWTINLDISEAGVSLLPNGIVANIEDIPLRAESVDTVLCVGSVLNYCDAAAAISELGRILRPGGDLVLEFESSLGGDLLSQEAFGRAAAIAETFYAHEPEVLWVYNPRYIRSLLRSSGFVVSSAISIHIASPWAFLVTHDISKATAMARFDRAFRFVPFLSRWASNQLFFCRKRTL